MTKDLRSSGLSPDQKCHVSPAGQQALEHLSSILKRLIAIDKTLGFGLERLQKSREDFLLLLMSILRVRIQNIVQKQMRPWSEYSDQDYLNLARSFVLGAGVGVVTIIASQPDPLKPGIPPEARSRSKPFNHQRISHAVTRYSRKRI